MTTLKQKVEGLLKLHEEAVMEHHGYIWQDDIDRGFGYFAKDEREFIALAANTAKDICESWIELRTALEFYANYKNHMTKVFDDDQRQLGFIPDDDFDGRDFGAKARAILAKIEMSKNVKDEGEL